MVRLSDSFSATSMVALVDAGVLAQMAEALSGAWSPDSEPDPERRRRMVTVARLRLYGTPDLSGCQLLTTQRAHEALSDEHGAPWPSGLVPVLERYEDSPLEQDVAGLERLLHQDGLDADAARTLALALLADVVDLVVTDRPGALHHERINDLPERLALLTPTEALDRLGLDPESLPEPELPGDSPLLDGDHWWVPDGSGSGA